MSKLRSNLSLPFSPRKLCGGGLLGLGTILLALLLFVLPVWTRLDCDRSVTDFVSCRLRGANLLGLPWRNIKVMPMVGAETNLQSVKGGYRYRTSIFTYNEEIPLAPFSVNERQARLAKEQVMAFLDDSTVR